MNEKQAKSIGDKLHVNWNKIDIGDFKTGIITEGKEHRDVTKGNGLIAGKIAHAHLKERPDYYRKLRNCKL